MPADADYADSLQRAAARAGTAESVVTGRILLEGREVAVIAGEFGFLAGSVGMAAADRVISAFRRATEERLPVIGAPTSGGTRMQEGTPAFLRMVPVAAAVAAHRAAGLPYLTWLRDPTTGGVMATWGSLGQLTVADPGALVGFLGPRVFEAMTGEAFPPVQRAENLARVGVIDDVVALPELREWVGKVLAVAQATQDGGSQPAARDRADQRVARTVPTSRPPGTDGSVCKPLDAPTDLECVKFWPPPLPRSPGCRAPPPGSATTR